MKISDTAEGMVNLQIWK